MSAVTFDSNVWQFACDPSRSNQESGHGEFVQIKQALSSGRIVGRLSETIFTLEGIRRVGRQAFLADYRMQTNFVEEETADGIRIGIAMGPDRTAHPGNNPHLDTHLTNALALGFRLMRCNRVAGIVNPDLRDEWFVNCAESEVHPRANKFGEVGRRIENAGAGMARIKEIGTRYANGDHWADGIRRAPATEEAAVAEAVAEWADGDSVAAHVAYGNELFCTNDRAMNAGSASVFSRLNREWLSRDYGVQFVSSAELARRLL